MARFIESRISDHMTEQEQIAALREEFQARVANHKFTITEEEATAMLIGAPATLLLEAFNITRKILSRSKHERTENQIVEGTQKNIASVLLQYPGVRPRVYSWVPRVVNDRKQTAPPALEQWELEMAGLV